MAEEVKMQPNSKEKKPREIPFGKPARIRNFKMWRTKVKLNKKETIEAIVISNLEGTWKVQIPQTYLMFHALTDLYATEDLKDFDILFSFLTNFNFCTQISHGDFQNFLILAVYGYMHPEVLEEGYEPEDKRFLSYSEFIHRIKLGVESYKANVAAEQKEKEKQNEEFEKSGLQEKIDAAKNGESVK